MLDPNKNTFSEGTWIDLLIDASPMWLQAADISQDFAKVQSDI